MASSVTWGAATFEFVDEGVAGDLVGGNVVVLDEVVGAAVHTTAVPGPSDAPLTGGRVALAA